MKSVSDAIVKALATCLYLTYLPALIVRGAWARKKWTGAGFIGTLAGLWSVQVLPIDPWRAACLLAGMTAASVAVSDRAEELLFTKDDSRIVIDEWVGYWFSVALLPRTTAVLIIGFVFFRIFDVFKLPWVRRAQDLPGGWGIVLDDVLAGLMANICLHVVRYIHPL